MTGGLAFTATPGNPLLIEPVWLERLLFSIDCGLVLFSPSSSDPAFFWGPRGSCLLCCPGSSIPWTIQSAFIACHLQEVVCKSDWPTLRFSRGLHFHQDRKLDNRTRDRRKEHMDYLAHHFCNGVLVVGSSPRYCFDLDSHAIYIDFHPVVQNRVSPYAPENMRTRDTE